MSAANNSVLAQGWAIVFRGTGLPMNCVNGVKVFHSAADARRYAMGVPGVDVVRVEVRTV